MVTNNAINTATGASGTVLQGAGVGTASIFTATPTVTSINFGGTALANYDEGTWTPTVVGNSVAGTTTYTTQVGYYVRIGNQIFCNGIITITAATGTGSALFGALPFTVKNQASYFPRGTILINGTSWPFPTSTTYPIFTPNANATTAFCNCAGSGIASSALQMANAACTFTFSFSYQI